MTLTEAFTRKEVEKALFETGVVALIDEPGQPLSGGEFQRMMLARTLLREPELLVLDEPAQGVDHLGEAELYGLIGRIREERGCAVLMVSHDLGQVRRIADDVLFLHNGRLVAHALTSDFLDAPKSELATAFVEGRLLW